MSGVKYSYLSWLRQGLTKAISTEDETESLARAQVHVKLKVKRTPISGATSVVDFDQTLTLAGPEDVIGINPEAIIKTVPQDNDTTFEPNYLAYIEFYEEDFPWRYTPFKATGGVIAEESTLRPWITLIVLKDEEYHHNGIAGNILPHITINSIGLATLPSPNTVWAWAHVQVNDTIDTTSSLTEGVNTKISENPNNAYSRLICPRKLDPDTKYTAFLVPTFEVGRRVGINDTAIAGIDRGLSAWGSPTTPSPLNMPVYYQWSFTTESQGDFESLVRAIKPKYLPYDFGQFDMDIQYPNHPDLNGLTGQTDGTLSFQGALKSDNALEDSYDILDTNNTFNENLKNILNDSNTKLTNDQSSTTVDPVITPPIYGSFAAKKPKLDDLTTENWINRVNLDPRYRTIAGYGAEVIRQNQEAYMQIAWSQVGDVVEANKRLNALYLKTKGATKVHHCNVEQSEDVTTVLFTGAVHKRIKSNTTIVQSIIDDSAVPNNMLTATFRKNSRPGLAVSKVVDYKLDTLVSSINAGTVIASPAYAAPQSISAMQFLTPAAGNCPAVQAATPYTNYAITSPGSTFVAGSPTANWNSGGQSMVTAVCSNGNNQQVFNSNGIANVTSMNFEQLATDIRAEVHPTKTVQNRGFDRIQIINAANEVTNPNSFDFIMEAPDIDVPLYKPLSEMFKEVFAPNLDALPNNSVSILKSNQKFIEAYLLGANHEFARELLWREYPTDQRGTCFKYFWPSLDLPSETDITPIASWSGLAELGSNTGRSFDPDDMLILAIRGDLLRKYPNTAIYAQKAIWDGDLRKLDISVELLKPVFFAPVKPDIYFVGFNLSVEQAIGDDTYSLIPTPSDPGYFFVFKELIGESKFGLDMETTGEEGTFPTKLNDMTWGHMKANSSDVVTEIKVARLQVQISTTPPATENYGLNSAKIAHALSQQPVKIAIHASQLLK